MPRKFASVPLRGIPDSMDVVSIWGGKTGLSKEQMADMKEVQTKKGTKVLCKKNQTPIWEIGI